MDKLLLHVIIELIQIDLESIILQMIICLKIIALEDGFIYKPKGKGIAEYGSELPLIPME